MDIERDEIQIISKATLKQKLTKKGQINTKSQIMSVRFGHQDSMIAYGCADGIVRIYNLIKQIQLSSLDTNIKTQETSHSTPVNSLVWRPQSQKIQTIGAVVLAANTNGHLYEFIAKTGKVIWHGIEQNNQIFSLDYSPDGICFATAGKDHIVRVYDQQKKTITHNLQGVFRQKVGHINRIFALSFKKQNCSLLASGGWDQNVHVWDLRIGEVVSTMVGPYITGQAIDFREDTILTGSNRGKQQLQLWDYRTHKILHTFVWDEQHKQNASSFINTCQFCPNSKNTVIAAGGNQLKMFALNDFQQLLQIRGHHQQSFFTCNSSAINNKYVVGGKQRNLHYLAANKIIQ